MKKYGMVYNKDTGEIVGTEREMTPKEFREAFIPDDLRRLNKKLDRRRRLYGAAWVVALLMWLYVFATYG